MNPSFEECGNCATQQEHYIANVLDSLEMGYFQRCGVGIDRIEGTDSYAYQYLWEFFLGDEVGLVIQADGANGHGTKYSFSDDVFQCARIDSLQNILHIEAETEEEIRDIILRALDNLTDSSKV